ncbi:phosphatidylserine decarboxylase [Rhizoctonia solani]|uniref:Phosphatidylserine decarboxylase n=1 Tax=Rhizoctonia solani TaxID=456999 RepID=A0A0K6FZA2_9AGAM|nr:phosphatidylserine decarboxylase [Rhizoctonia solani]
MILIPVIGDSASNYVSSKPSNPDSPQEQEERPLGDSQWLPVIKEFQDLIEGNEVLLRGFTQMFEQASTISGGSRARSYKDMRHSINDEIQQAPRYRRVDYVGCNLYHVLDKVMCTPIGLVTLANPLVNNQFKKIFDVWAAFLSSGQSRSVLTTDEDGWFGPTARVDVPHFFDTFINDHNHPYGGFKSWDDFFTRPLRPGARPVGHPENNSIITSACESIVYRVANNIKERDSFWLKGQPYSLRNMFQDGPFTGRFVGGSILQCFLPSINYHRWHSPVNGRVVKTRKNPGIYYSQASPTPDGPQLDPAASQGFLTAVATRALVFIESDNPHIGLMCLMAVAMIEVSTCDIRVKVNDRVVKGQELGMFHFGGSTYCMLFRAGVKVEFSCAPGDSVLVNSAIATVSV